jgi:xanthine dehydrogenase YagR molybdenum-binding subunit
MTASSTERPIRRVDGRLKVTGAARYAADRTPAGLVHGYLVTSTVAHGTVQTIDASAALASEGVLTVFSADNPLPWSPPRTPVIFVIGEGRRPFQDREVSYHGQIVAMVVAETFEQARDAAALVEVTYETERPNSSFEGAVPYSVIPPPPFGQPVQVLAEGVEDIETALAGSEVVQSGVYTQPAQQHNALETHGAVAEWEDGMLTVHSATQGPALHAIDIAEALGIEPGQVHVLSPHIGGAFGGKAITWAPTLLAAAAARELGRPVKVTATREQTYTVTGHRSPAHQEISIGATRDGRLTALRHESVSELVRENPSVVSTLYYQVPSIAAILKVVRLNLPKATIMRAPGYSPGSFALESAMDELAGTLGLDPVELRLRNLMTTAPDTGLPYSSKHLDECCRVGAERFGWSRRAAAPRSRVDGDWLVGAGMATGVLPAERPMAAARMRFRPDGRVEVGVANSDLGTGAWTTLTVLAADRLGLSPDRIEPSLGHSRLPRNPADLSAMMGAVLSSTTASMSAAVEGAASAAVTALVEHAVGHERSPFHGLAATDLRYERGELVSRAQSMPFADLLTVTAADGIEVEHVPGPIDATRAFASYAAYFFEVRVNRWTGEPRLSRATVVVDAGTIVHEAAARNQIMGGVVMGLGHALLEEVQVEPATGRIANANLADYLIPVNADVPDLDVHFLDHPDTAFTPNGARGLAELGCVGSAAAVANAVYNATGVRVRDLPITAEKLLGLRDAGL